ncbi:MAG: hypothetical protein J6N52_04725 [Clostridia bacterium]|nr:hypothetical protein [Clostridia bacterium]
MKRSAKFILACLIFILSFNTVVFAASNTYKLPELGLDITIPSAYKVITRDTLANSSVFSDSEKTKSDIMNYFEENDIYLNAFSNSLDEEIVVAMSSNPISDFNLFSDYALTQYRLHLLNNSANKESLCPIMKFISILKLNLSRFIHPVRKTLCMAYNTVLYITIKQQFLQ